MIRCAVLLIVLLTSCGQPNLQPRDQPTPPAVTTTLLNLVTVQGVVEQGTEANCLLLRMDGRTYLLLGGEREDRDRLTVGTEVIVEGEPRPGAPVTCQQGTPFLVKNVRRP